MAVAVVCCVLLVCVTVVVVNERRAPAIVQEPVSDARTEPSSIESRLRERILVTLRSGEAFAGVLWEADDRVWVLRSAEAVNGNQRPVPVDGEVVVLTANVAYANKP